MSKKRRVVIGFAIASILMVAVLASFGNAATVSHSAGQILAGTFGIGNFTFNGSFSVQNSTGTSYFYVDSSSGNVGIGTTSPSTALDVNGNVTASYYLGDGSLLTGIGGASGIWTNVSGAATYYGDVNITGNLSLGGEITGQEESAARAYLTGTQVATTATWTKVNFDGLDYDTLGEMDITTCDCFNATTAGYYLAIGSVLINNLGADKAFDVLLARNGGSVGMSTTRVGSLTTDATLGVSQVVYLDVGDVITLSARHTHGSDLNIGYSSYATSLAVYKLKAPITIGGESLWTNSSGNATYTAGNVGIGTTSPSWLLHIKSSSSSVNPAISLENDNAVENIIYTGRSGLGGGFSDDLLLQTAASKDIHFVPGGTTKVSMLNDGNVGIGTTDPQNLLHVSSSANGVIARFNSSYTNGATSLSIGNDAKDWLLKTDGAQSDAFIIRESGVADYFTILPTSGNIGIGTTSPNATLHLYADDDDFVGSVNDRLIMDTYDNSAGSDFGDGTAILFRVMDGATNMDNAARIAGILTNTNSGQEEGALAFYTRGPSGAALQEKMRIDTDGNVGINTTNPTSTLQVLGAANFTSILGPWVNNSGTTGVVDLGDLRVMWGVQTGITPSWTNGVTHAYSGPHYNAFPAAFADTNYIVVVSVIDGSVSGRAAWSTYATTYNTTHFQQYLAAPEPAESETTALSVTYVAFGNKP